MTLFDRIAAKVACVTFARIGVSPQNPSRLESTHTPSTCSSLSHFGHSSSSQSRTSKRRQSRPKLCAAPQISRFLDCAGRHRDLDDVIPTVSSFEVKPMVRVLDISCSHRSRIVIGSCNARSSLKRHIQSLPCVPSFRLCPDNSHCLQL